MNKTEEKWIIKTHCGQIADTGDYDSSYEITNGKVSLFTKDDPEAEALKAIINALNASHCKFEVSDEDYSKGFLDGCAFGDRILESKIKKLEESAATHDSLYEEYCDEADRGAAYGFRKAIEILKQ